MHFTPFYPSGEVKWGSTKNKLKVLLAKVATKYCFVILIIHACA